jgi:hypothetical protein
VSNNGRRSGIYGLGESTGLVRFAGLVLDLDARTLGREAGERAVCGALRPYQEPTTNAR